MTFAVRRLRPVALVTGATGGIGFFIGAGLAHRGWAVVVTGCDQSRGEDAAGALRRRAGHDDVRFVPVDHAVVGANAGLAARVDREVKSLDLLVNNVGGIYADRWETADGHEATLAMNFVGPVALTLGLLPALRRTTGRCVNVVSSAFTMAKGDPFGDLPFERDYVGIKAYARAKLLNVLWMRALAGREPDLTVNAVNPGMAWTPSTEALTPAAVPAWRFVWPVVHWFQRRASAEKAATTPVQLCVGELEAPSGTYISDKSKPGTLPDTASDPATLGRVWALGEALTTRTAATRRPQLGVHDENEPLPH